MELNQIGFFQLDNLIQSRVQFVLVNLGVDIKPWYKLMAAMHLQNVSVECTVENALSEVQAKKLPPHFAVVLLDRDGTVAVKLAAEFEKAGFINTYFVRGGFEGLVSERAAEGL
jgi:hypothetical protein